MSNTNTKKGIDPVTVFVYFLIFILICIIILPPVLRIFVSGDEESGPSEIPNVTASTLSCTATEARDIYNIEKIIRTIYQDDTISQISFSYKVVRADSSSLDQPENQDSSSQDGDESINVDMANVSMPELDALKELDGAMFNESGNQRTLMIPKKAIAGGDRSLINDYIQEIQAQKLYYENNNFTCTISES